MATLDSSNILDGNTIEPTDIIQLYDALTPGGGTTGAYNVTVSGSLIGNASTATSSSYTLSSSYALSSSFSISSSYVLSSSYALSSSNALSSSYALSSSNALSSSVSVTASYALSGAGNGFPYTGSAAITGSLSITGSTSITSTFTTSGSRVRRYRTITLTDSDYAISPIPAVSSDDDIVLVIDNTTGAPDAGESNLNIANFLNSTAGRCIEIVKVKDGTGTGIIISAPAMSGNFLMLNNVSLGNGTQIINPSSGNSVTLMSQGLSQTGSIWGTGY